MNRKKDFMLNADFVALDLREVSKEKIKKLIVFLEAEDIPTTGIYDAVIEVEKKYFMEDLAGDEDRADILEEYTTEDVEVAAEKILDNILCDIQRGMKQDYLIESWL